MPKMLTKEEYRYIKDDAINGVYPAQSGIKLLEHIDALTERLEGMADEWDQQEQTSPHDNWCGRGDELRAFIKEMKG